MPATTSTTTQLQSKGDVRKACDVVLDFLNHQQPGNYLDQDEHEITKALLLRVKTQYTPQVSIEYTAGDKILTSA